MFCSTSYVLLVRLSSAMYSPVSYHPHYPVYLIRQFSSVPFLLTCVCYPVQFKSAYVLSIHSLQYAPSTSPICQRVLHLGPLFSLTTPHHDADRMTRLVLRRHDMNPVDLELYQWQQAAFFFLERELGVNLWLMLQNEQSLREFIWLWRVLEGTAVLHLLPHLHASLSHGK